MEVFIMSATSLYRLFAPQIEFLSPAEKQVFFYIDNHISTIENVPHISSGVNQCQYHNRY